MKSIQLTKHESLLLLACKGWDLTEFLTEPVDTSLVLRPAVDLKPCYLPLKCMVLDYTELTEYYHITYIDLVDVDLYTVVTRDLLELVTKLRPAYVNECVINSISITKSHNTGHNYLFQLLRGQLSQLNTDQYKLCTEQLPTKYVDKYLKD